jgi:demethylmenaquinone methyltransferase/2-methoxy-6-polyprenyl-1,4-benzoquinol methylase
MFDSIAHRYDFLNHLLSAGMDRRWRREGIRRLGVAPGACILDIAAGTGDLALSALKGRPSLVVGVDVSREMLIRGREKFDGVRTPVMPVQAGVEDLPFPAERFDAAMVAYGVRNFADIQRGLEEVFRVLKPGGKFLVLEFSQPRMPVVRQLYFLYFNYLLPLVGRIFSRSSFAYTYLPKSVGNFPSPEEFIALLKESGFREAAWKPQTFGISILYLATK